MKDNELTKRQEEIFAFIENSINSNGFPPTIPEIQEEFSFKSPTAANDHLETLARKGYIRRHYGKSRGIELIRNIKEKYVKYKIINCGINAPGHEPYPESLMEIPLLGRIAAGAPLLAQENKEGSIFVDRAFVRIKNGVMEGVFALRVKGDSMIDAGIFDGDYVIIEKQARLDQGEIGAVLIDDEATIKRVFMEKNRLCLQPENKEMEPVIINPGDHDVSVIGRVCTVIRKL